MSKFITFFRLMCYDRLKLKKRITTYFGRSKISRFVPDKIYLKHQYRNYVGKKLNLDDPKTFNEKLQWLKLYERNPIYITMVDKHRVKEYVEKIIGNEYLIPTYGVWNSFDEIDFEKIPSSFVLKCTHDSGSVVVCKDIKDLDKNAAKGKLCKGLKNNLFWWGREWPYKDVPRKIIAEQYIQDSNGELLDYKFMCFGGKVKCSFVCSDRFSEKGLHVTFFDREWNVMPFERHYPSVKEGMPKPQNYEKMIELAEILSHNIPFVRVDFYEVDGKIYFGELTLYPGCGFEEFTPEEWDKTLGDWIELPPKTK